MSRRIRIFSLLAALAIVVDLVGHRRALQADDVYRVASIRIPERGLGAYRPGEVIVQFKEAVRDRDASDMMREAGSRSAPRGDFGPPYLGRLDAAPPSRARPSPPRSRRPPTTTSGSPGSRSGARSCR